MIKIYFKNKTYKLDKKKLLNILSILEAREIKEFEIKFLMKKFDLYEEYFLNNINNL